MPEYKAIYLQLFNTVTTVIELLQLAQQQAVELYISEEEKES